jgi:formylglycine-generating enzyme required for sulfatase activity
MSWPLSQDYNEAIQDSLLCFADDELRAAQVVTNALGLPMPRSGNFADVYEMCSATGDRRWAVKCFTRAVPGQRERYAAISDHLRQAQLRFTVEFRYLEQGIRVAGQWYPVLKMDWVEGLLLNEFVRQYLDRPAMLEALANLWVKLAGKLRNAGIAHGDLQHGNVLLVPGRDEKHLALRLVDYDGMFVPALARNPSGEVGHPSYQHPQRLREAIYSAEVDRFPLLVIYTAIRALITGGRPMWDRFDNGDNLLFCRMDFEAPTKSALFAALLRASDPEVRSLAADLIDAACRLPLEQAPLLDELSAGVWPVPEPGQPPPPAAAAVAPPALAAAPSAAKAPAAPVVLPAAGSATDSAQRTGKAGTPSRRTLILAGGLAVGTIGVILVGGIGVLVAMLASNPSAERVADAHVLVLAKDQGQPTLPQSSAAVDEKADTQEQKSAAGAMPGGLGQGKSKPVIDEDRKPILGQGKSKPVIDEDRKPISLAAAKPSSEHAKPAATAKPELTQSVTPGIAKADPYEIVNSIGMRLRLIAPGEFLMGSPESEDGHNADEMLHLVNIARAFYMGAFEVTQAEYQKVTGKNPARLPSGKGGSPEFPIDNITWEQAQAFCKMLSTLPEEKRAGRVYRLPTEAEWEYACRAGTRSAFYCGMSLSAAQARINGQFSLPKAPYVDSPIKVGSFEPNGFGLYDMHGNVWEWCDDWYRPDYYKLSPRENPRNSEPTKERVLRGGSWNWRPLDCRSACRGHYPATSAHVGSGFRVVFTALVKKETPEAPLPQTFKNTIGIEFLLVPRGKSWLGGEGGKPGEEEVEIPQDFYLGKYLVTQAEWQQVMGTNPSRFKAVPGVSSKDQKRFPVESVSWNDVQEFLRKLNERDRQAGWLYRLPKKTEWEYACRGGPMTDKATSAFDYYFAKPTNKLLPTQANFYHGTGSLQRTQKVGSYPPNKLGLYDMHGNLWEWCCDSRIDKTLRIICRGGSWTAEAAGCRAANRPDEVPSKRDHGIGLRIARLRIGREPQAK